MKRPHQVCLCAVLALLMATAATAEVKLRRAPNGRLQITDEGGGSPPAAPSARLRETPDLEPLIRIHCDAQRLDPRLVRAVIQTESAYNPRAVSRRGALGLMQLMPETARELQVLDAFDPDQNLRGGTLYLRRLLDRFSGRIELALAAYNAGPGAVERHGGIPPYAETRSYVRKILSLYKGGNVVLPAALRTSPAPTPREPRVPGARVHLVRDSRNRLVITTSPGGTR